MKEILGYGYCLTDLGGYEGIVLVYLKKKTRVKIKYANISRATIRGALKDARKILCT